MHSRRRGGVLVISLVILTGAVASLAVVASNQQLRMTTTQNRLEKQRARLAAESGIARAMAALATQDPNLVLQEGDWFDLGSEAQDRFVLPRDSFRLQVIDAASLVSVNTATEDQLLNLGSTTEQVDSLLDWREEGNNPRPEGAKNEFYNNLAEPYNLRGRLLESADELLLVKGFDFQSVYGALADTGNAIRNGDGAFALYQLVTTDSQSPNLGPDGQPRPSINEAGLGQLTAAGIPVQVAAAIVARRNGLGGAFASMQQVFETPGVNTGVAGTLVDNFTVATGATAPGRINLNTAREGTLQSITELADFAADIISRQANGGFGALSELLQIPGMTVQALGAAADRIAIGSDTFVVRVTGRAGRTDVSLEAVVRLVSGVPTLIKTYETPQPDMRALWNWRDETTNEVEISG